MTIDEFLKRASFQPVVIEPRTVNVWGPRLRELTAQRKPTMTLAEISAHTGQSREARTYPRGHVLGLGLPYDAIEFWQQKWPSCPLPPDLTALPNRVNGIHLWADLDSQKAYFGILPLNEWEAVSQSRLAPLLEEQTSGQLLMSYHANADYYLVLDTQECAYFGYDTQDSGGEPVLVARKVEELLSWCWEQAAELAPEVPNSP